MQKRSRKWVWFIFIVFQALIGTCVGLFALSTEKVETYPSGTTVQSVDIGRLTYDEAKATLADHYDFLINQGKLTLEVNSSEYIISNKDIDLRFDVAGTLDGISEDLSRDALNQLIAGETEPKSYPPVVAFNTGKLTAALEKGFKAYEKDPVPDTYQIKDGQLVYTPKITGIRIDYAALEKLISPDILDLSTDVLTIDPNDGSIFKAFAGEETGLKDLFNTIVSHSAIPLGAANRDEASQIMKSLIGKVFLPGESIKLSGMVDLSGAYTEGRRDMINRTATAVYQAFLPIQGINIINRRQSEITLPYSEAGLEAVIEGDNGDLELKNDTDHELMLLGEIRNGSIELYVVSGEEIPNGVLIAQKKDIVSPPVIYNVNGELKEGETKVISEGSEGFSVDIGRVIGNEREELYTDRYEPVSKVVEVSGEPINTGLK